TRSDRDWSSDVCSSDLARWPLIAFLLIHATVFLIGAFEAALHLFPTTGQVGLGVVFGMVHFEELIFVMGSAISMVVIVRERSERSEERRVGKECRVRES